MGGDGFGDDGPKLVSIDQRSQGTQSQYCAVYIRLSCGLVDVLCDGSWGAMGAVIARGFKRSYGDYRSTDFGGCFVPCWRISILWI